MQKWWILIGNIYDSIFYIVDKEDDPALEAYVPFRVFSKYLINKGFGGVAYRSTRMALAGLQGKCLTLFNPEDAIYVQGEMEVYEYHKEGCAFLKKYWGWRDNLEDKIWEYTFLIKSDIISVYTKGDEWYGSCS